MTQLRKLELQGFKTFVGKTEFHFPDGVTAIVGPNGSGKSNLADAVRWILGEQRASVLRARTNADMIFSGTERRARMGMAYAAMTIDNADGLLPIDFSEVVIGRRAYRSGESEYLINGTRVRLRDVQELLAHAGIGTTTYTVIGQGLVDAALALRVEERRQLVEDAAGLGAYQGRRNEALRRLARTEEHLIRVRDILAEIEPQMRRLRRQADRAAEYTDLHSSLADMLRTLYGFRYGRAAQALQVATSEERDARAEVAAATHEVREIEREVERLRARQGELRTLLTDGRRRRAELRSNAEQLRRERAVTAERQRGLLRQSAALEEEREQLEAERARLQRRLDESATEGERLAAARVAAEEALASAQAALEEAESSRGTLREALDEARREMGQLSARRGELAQRRQALQERQSTLDEEERQHDTAVEELERRLAGHADELALLVEEQQTLRQQLDALREERRGLVDRRSATSTRVRGARERAHALDRARAELATRGELLERLRTEGAGYEGGLRALLAERDRFGDALRGPLAELLQVPEKYAVAIAAALRGRLEAMVVEGDPTPLREWLATSDEGVVALLPLGALDPPDRGRMPRRNGLVGRAADMVESEEPELLEYLLGDWLVVESWDDISALADRGWNLVTLDGQLRWRRGGLVAGRGTGSGSDLLSRSREWAELPERLAAAQAEHASATAELEEAEAAAAEVERALGDLDATLAESDRRAQQIERQLASARGAAEKLEQEAAWRRELLERARSARESSREARETLEREQVELERALAEQERLIAERERALDRAHPGALREAVERARTAIAVNDEQRASWERTHRTLAETLERSIAQLDARAERGTRLAAELEALGARGGEIADEVADAEARLAASVDESQPLESEQAHAEEQLAALESRHTIARRRRHEHEDALHTAQLARQSAEERLAHLREQIENDLGMVELQEEAGIAHQSMLPIEELVTSLPRVEELPEGLENDVRRLRRRLAYLGAINPDAPQEYAELEERFEFLTEQSADLERASADLRKVVSELDQIMEERFVTVFEAIDLAFRDYFARLFGGGQARLELTDPDDITQTGVEIIARPPGKRMQSIALLSGGERALTAAALVFAILRASPAPFCVLDEVDAMLDEANVGRFRDLLLELAQKTQFVVITHNRGTIEAADAIYGISQTDPGISEVISLQLEEAVAASKH